MLMYIKDGIKVTCRELSTEEKVFYEMDYVCEVRLMYSNTLIVSYYDTYTNCKLFFKHEMQKLQDSMAVPF